MEKTTEGGKLINPPNPHQAAPMAACPNTEPDSTENDMQIAK